MHPYRLFALALSLAVAPVVAHAAEPIDFAQDVRPLLARHCVSCHGPTKQSGSLRLDSFSRLSEGGNAGPAFVAGNSKASRLAIAVTGGTKDVAAMPPKGKLTADEQMILRRWIDEGARGPKTENTVTGGPSSTHWSFQPVRKQPVPAVQREAWARNAIDVFVLAELEKKMIAPAAEADRMTLIRRLSLDLTGLPPTIAEVDRFLNESATDPETAYEALVDRLLASPHYGEMQARHWLDHARYADSNGFSIDAPRSIWKYRDWVIDAFNRDMPFDRFTIEQLAGDLLPKATNEQRIATGFHRNTAINQEGGIDLEQFRVESIVDRVNTTGSVWLGVTIGCCQCHDHKFDPFSQREYYQFFAFFNNCDEPNLEVMTPAEKVRRDNIRARLDLIEKQWRLLDPTSEKTVRQWELGITDETRPMLKQSIRDIFAVADNGRSPKQTKILEGAYRFADQVRHPLGALLGPVSAVAHSGLLNTRLELQNAHVELKKQGSEVVTTMVLQERAKPRITHIQLGGDYLRPGVIVKPGTPSVLPPLAAGSSRLEMARWLVDGRQPLTPRVAVNRYWGQFFGTGIVETENDFGTQGTPPSHPALLDYLADQFVSNGWSMKKMHKLIVTSATYRQSSNARADLTVIDPRNRLLARQARLRVPAEGVRDMSLAASGLLNPKIGGPSVFPPQPDGVYRFTQIDKAWKESAGTDRYRRGMYTHFWRSAPHPALVVFDAPDSTSACTRRSRSNTPLQALTLLNDAGFYEYAQALADRVLKLGATDDDARLLHAFRLCFARQPSERESKRLRNFLASQRQYLQADIQEARTLANVPLSDSDTTCVERAAWILTARVLLNLDELITRE